MKKHVTSAEVDDKLARKYAAARRRAARAKADELRRRAVSVWRTSLTLQLEAMRLMGAADALEAGEGD